MMDIITFFGALVVAAAIGVWVGRITNESFWAYSTQKEFDKTDRHFDNVDKRLINLQEQIKLKANKGE